MNRIISFLLCAGLVLAAMAGEPQLSRSQLKHASITKEQIPASATVTGQEKPISLQQVLKERHLTLNDNRLNQKAPQSLRINDNQGQRIASMDIYDFNWDYEKDIAVVIDTSCAMAGTICSLSYNNNFILSDFFDSYSIPLTTDEETGILELRAGVVLDQQTIQEQYDPYTPITLQGSHEPDPYRIITRYLYAMPLSWLTGDDTYDDIPCQVGEDGSIQIQGAFGFLVKTHITTSDGSVSTTNWGLSAIYDNVVLLKANAMHRYSYYFNSTPLDFNEDNDPSHWGMGGGGLTPRPITTRPINTKPVRPRHFESVIGRSLNAGIESGRNKETTSSPERDITTRGLSYTTASQPVYMYMLDDTTLMVYNLYNQDYSWNYMYLQPDGTVNFPKQALLGKSDTIYYNASKHDNNYRWGNTGRWNTDSITWDKTFVITEDASSYLNAYFNNKLYFYSDSTTNTHRAPVFLEPVITEYEVMFSATSVENSLDIVFLYVYDEEYDWFLEVDNPCFFPRQDKPYTVLLAAETFYDDTGEYSDPAYLEYEVPALGSGYVRGDANNDGNLNINDVTALINALLTADFNDSQTFNHTNADCDLDGTLKINDVTTLIGFLLSGNWLDASN